MSNLMSLNNMPRNTYRFLGVNGISLKDVFIPEFKQSPLEIDEVNNEELGYTLRNITKGDLKVINFNNKSNFLSQDGLKDFNKEIEDGFYLEVEPYVKLKENIQINLDFSKEAPSLIAKNLIYMRKDSEGTIVINSKNNDEDYSFLLSNTSVVLEENAKLTLVRVQGLNKDSINIEGIDSTLLKASKLNVISADIGGGKNIVNIYNNLQGDGAEGNIDAIYIGDKEKLIDISQYSLFNGQDTKSDINNKGVLLDKAKKTLRYTLDFKKGSKGSEGKENEYIMLLTPKAKNSSVPLLLAAENDVKGEHGASIGRIHEDTLFYLMSRGLSEKEARALIIKGSLAAVIDKLPNEDLKNYVLEEIDKRVMIDE